MKERQPSILLPKAGGGGIGVRKKNTSKDLAQLDVRGEQGILRRGRFLTTRVRACKQVIREERWFSAALPFQPRCQVSVSLRKKGQRQITTTPNRLKNTD